MIEPCADVAENVFISDSVSVGEEGREGKSVPDGEALPPMAWFLELVHQGDGVVLH